MIANPTRTYTSLDAAYDHFNRELFGGQLPPCLITMQRHKGAYGYFSGERFASLDNPEEVTDEIALNPAHFASRTPAETLSTLVHEMCPSLAAPFRHAVADRLPQQGMGREDAGGRLDPDRHRPARRQGHRPEGDALSSRRADASSRRAPPTWRPAPPSSTTTGQATAKPPPPARRKPPARPNTPARHATSTPGPSPTPT